MKSLVGYTGFVGSNICASEKFDAVYNSKNIADAYGTNPELLIYAGVRAEKYIANQDPKRDMELIYQAEENISRINPKKLVLISTIDVFKSPNEVNENTVINVENLHAYGFDRYKLELWAREKIPNTLIVRLPGLFGKNIKKNFIYDYINIIPFMIKKEKFQELQNIEPCLNKYYKLMDNGFYKVDASKSDKDFLKGVFGEIGFSALNFTDSRSSYQFYNLSRLWDDICVALDERIELLHLATEPITAGEIYNYLCGKKFENELSGSPADYDFRTIHDKKFGGTNGYICDKAQVLKDIKEFVESEEHK